MKSIITKLVLCIFLLLFGTIALNYLGMIMYWAFIITLSIVHFGLFIFSVDLLQKHTMPENSKALWVIVTLIFPILGPFSCVHINNIEKKITSG